MTRHEIGENVVNSKDQSGACEKLLQDASHIWTATHDRSALPSQTQSHTADNAFSHQMQQLDKGLHAAGGPLHGQNDLHMVGFDSKGRLMIAHVPNGKSRADEMYLVDPKNGKIVAECAWKDGKAAGKWKKAEDYAQSGVKLVDQVKPDQSQPEVEDFQITNMRQYFFRPVPGQINRFDQIDADGNGALAKTEFLNFQSSLPPEQKKSLDVIATNFNAIQRTSDDRYFGQGEAAGIYRQDLDQWLKRPNPQESLPSLQLISGPDTPPINDKQRLA